MGARSSVLRLAAEPEQNFADLSEVGKRHSKLIGRSPIRFGGLGTLYKAAFGSRVLFGGSCCNVPAPSSIHWIGSKHRTSDMALQYCVIPVTPFQQNCSLVWCDATQEAALIDPGGELPRLLAAVRERGLTLKAIWLTHAHIDHAGGAGQLAREQQLPIIGPHPGDQFWIDGLAQQSAMFGFPPAEPFTPDRWLADGDTVTLGHETVDVRHCPGHTPGHVVFHSASAKRVFVGDVLFVGSIGRTDFPGGNHQQLLDSIRERLWPMGDDTVFIPGHGPQGSLGEERRSNPFVADRRG